MKAIVNTGPDRLELQEVPTPEPGKEQVRVKVRACGICATDLCMMAGWARTGFPAIPGHEWSGIVDAVGAGVDAGLAGKPCVAENVLRDGGEVGFEHSGGYGEYLITDAKNVQVLPDSLSAVEAALIEPLAVSVRALNRLTLTHKNGALIFGDGPIGMLMLMLLRRAGVYPLYLAGGRNERLSLCRELGAQGTINYHDAGKTLADTIASVTRTFSFPNLIEASGSVTAMKTAMELGAAGAKILVIGDYGTATADFPWNMLLHKELKLIGSNASAAAWPEAVAIACEPSFPLKRLVSHVLPYPQFAEGIELAKSRRGDVVKVVLLWE